MSWIWCLHVYLSGKLDWWSLIFRKVLSWPLVMFVLLSVNIFSNVALTCRVGRFYYLCAWILRLLISYALSFIYNFPRYPSDILLCCIFVPVLLSFVLHSHWDESSLCECFLFGNKLKKLGFLHLSMLFTIQSVIFQKCSVMACHIEKERQMKWKQCKTGVKQVWKCHIHVASKLYMLNVP